MSIKTGKGRFPPQAHVRLQAAERSVFGDKDLFVTNRSGGQRFVDKVLCLHCGVVIASLVPHPQHRGRVVMAMTPEYTSVMLEFSDGSAHEMPVCKQAMAELSDDEDTLDALYLADLAASAELHGSASLPLMLGRGRPVRVKPGRVA